MVRHCWHLAASVYAPPSVLTVIDIERTLRRLHFKLKPEARFLATCSIQELTPIRPYSQHYLSPRLRGDLPGGASLLVSMGTSASLQPRCQ